MKSNCPVVFLQTCTADSLDGGLTDSDSFLADIPAGRLDLVDADTLGWWLCERQLPSGGLNGRPEKLPDVCYSWWVLASLSMLGRLHWVDRQRLIAFISACQDEAGGFSDRPGDMPDPFHTLFGLAALSLLGEPSLAQVDPTFCMPRLVLQRLGVRPQKLTVS